MGIPVALGAHLLGRNLERDDRSWNFRSEFTSALGKNVTHALNIPHLNQGDLGSCEGNTAAEFLGCSKALKNRKAFNTFWNKSNKSVFPTEDDAVKLYSKATTLDNDEIQGAYPPKDTGTSGNGIAKALRAFNAIAAFNWCFDWNGFLGTLETQPVMLGMNWYQDMFNIDKDGYVHPTGDLAGGHAVLAYSVEFNDKYAGGVRIGCTNHWNDESGNIWGVKIGAHPGSFWLSGDDAEQLLIADKGDMLVPVLM